jgi:hypothetical protein
MRLRSSAKEVIIDFDEASLEWRKNKRALPNGMMKYICMHTGNKNNTCKRQPLPGLDYCDQHNKLNK